MNPVRSSPAVVLRWRAYGESDKIATLLTRDFGKLTGIAKGAQRSRRRFVNSLESLARVRAHFRCRTGGSLAFLESCDLLRAPGGLTDPLRFAYAGYLAELTDRLTVEDHPVPEIYALLEDSLEALSTRHASGEFLRTFEVQLLGRAGFEPQLESCRACHVSIAPEDQAAIESRHGTVLCTRCAATEPVPSTPVSGAALARLNALQRLSVSHTGAVSLGEYASEATAVTGQLLALHLTRPLKSLRVIAQATAQQHPGADRSPATRPR